MESLLEEAESLIRYRISDRDFEPDEDHHSQGNNVYIADYDKYGEELSTHCQKEPGS
jgi:hypothetical protein